MREIKFRVWDENSESMIYDIGITPEGIPYSIPEYAEASDQFNYYPSCHKMQYTGLKDKQGNDIYEGDIVRASSEGSWGSFEVRWRQEGLPCWILYPAWLSDQFWKLHGSKRSDGHYYDFVEVIGNIYESE